MMLIAPAFNSHGQVQVDRAFGRSDEETRRPVTSTPGASASRFFKEPVDPQVQLSASKPCAVCRKALGLFAWSHPHKRPSIRTR